MLSVIDEVSLLMDHHHDVLFAMEQYRLFVKDYLDVEEENQKSAGAESGSADFGMDDEADAEEGATAAS